MSSRKERTALKRRKLAKTTYREHLLDTYCVEIPGAQTARVRRKIKRQTKVRS